ncbi:hypothetical protein [Bosea sp. (in: a-proteobacteria)]|uniref:hypothetical protein n=1 Tax=Bosea sp. (in: a-proteobacteria) TaxID=1871050 RepID=UPI002FC70BA9
MARDDWSGSPERRRVERRGLPAPLVPAAFLVQLAASHAGIGPFAGRDRETPAAAAGLYRRTGRNPHGTARIAPRLA